MRRDFHRDEKSLIRGVVVEDFLSGYFFSASRVPLLGLENNLL